MMKKISILILFAVLLANADLYDTFPSKVCGSSDYGVFFSSWAITCYIAIMASISLYILIFLVSRALNNGKGEVWAKMEMLQVVLTAFILIFIVGFSQFVMCTMTPEMIFGAGTESWRDKPMMDAGKNYLTTMIQWNVRSLTMAFFVGTIRELIGNLEISIEILEMGAKIKPFSGLNSFDNGFELIKGGLIAILILNLAQLAFFMYVETAMFGIFLPIGILLRCYAPTRRFGGGIIGIVLAVGIVWPLVLVVNNIAIGGVHVSAVFEDSWIHISNVVGNNFSFIGDLEGGNIIDYLKNLKDIPNAFRNSIQGMFSAFLMTLWNVLAINILGSLFFPMLNFAIIAASMREFSRFFGEQIDLSNLTRMI